MLHSCCGPCSTAVIERLAEDYDITVLFFNPNITEPEEYAKRLEEEKRFLLQFEQDTGVHCELIEGRYDPREFFAAAKGLEAEPEGGLRCVQCFALRMGEAARVAKEQCFDCFDSTLSVSSHKNYELLKAAGEAASAAEGVPYQAGNYKKKNGYFRSIELSRQYGLYRQNYCGCIFSKRDAK
ncbi:MAG: epoxyqueuosine reductase QueH [Firmicutes bacterium]|nr:epoxyqueuosine reductase QueH [Bacillota bacterium]